MSNSQVTLRTAHKDFIKYLKGKGRAIATILAYGNDIKQFVKRGISLGGEQMNHGDASVKLFPFPRVPVVLIFWEYDKEFPSRADILFDSVCSKHLPTDIIWATAMMSILVML